jgi:hypothetical protein
MNEVMLVGDECVTMQGNVERMEFVNDDKLKSVQEACAYIMSSDRCTAERAYRIYAARVSADINVRSRRS